MFNLSENIELSYEWLTKEIIKQTIQQQKTGKTVKVTVDYIKLLRLFQKFIDLNIKTR